MSNVYSALSHETRREILRLLRGRPMSAGAIAGHFDLALSSLSGHLKVLREAELVTGVRSASTITYEINLPALESAVMTLITKYDLQTDLGDPKP